MAKKKKKISEDKDLVPVEIQNRKLWAAFIGIAVFIVIMFSSKTFMPSGSSKLDLGPITANGEMYIVINPN